MERQLEPEISCNVDIILERKKSRHPWADFVWSGVDVVSPSTGNGRWQLVEEGAEVSRFRFGPVALTLHRRMGEAYDANFQTGEPALWMMLDDELGETVPYKVRAVTADPYEALGFQDSAEGLVARIPMPPDILHWAIAYVSQMPDPEKFKKRRRDGIRLEEQKFGKVPIFEQGGRHSPGDAE